MPMFLVQLWRIYEIALQYATADNFAKIVSLFNKAQIDWLGGDYRQLIIDLVNGLAGLIPAGAHPALIQAAAITPSEASLMAALKAEPDLTLKV